MSGELKAPFPWFGGKARVADEVWARFGDVPNYVEPFFGSGAMLLARPDSHDWAHRIETANDADGYVSNLWRAVRGDPEGVAYFADWPVNENDLHARHAWLVAQRERIVPMLEGDPDWFDVKVAGWWLWGICLWIGSGWCSGEGSWQQVDGKLVHLGNAGRGVNRQLVHLGNAGRGVNRKRVHLGDAGVGVNRKRVHLGNAGQGVNRQRVDASTCDSWSAHLVETMTALSDRLRRVRVCSGDWSRVCGPSPTERLGITGVFLDPPYSHAERQSDLYRVEMQVADSVREWAIARGDNPMYRIALCGYDGEHAMPEGWTAHHWKANGGYGNLGENRGRANAHREVVWFSRHCLTPDAQQALPMEALE